jgi:hypothetical protein
MMSSTSTPFHHAMRKWWSTNIYRKPTGWASALFASFMAAALAFNVKW